MFGRGNSPSGIQKFLDVHHCNEYCKSSMKFSFSEQDQSQLEVENLGE